MKKLILLLIFVPVIAFGKQYGTIKNVEFVSCHDGDTCKFNIPDLHPIIGDKISIRLNGIDTPEIKGECAKEKKDALRAKKWINHYLSKAENIELRNVSRGTYFQIVADIWVGDVNVNQKLIYVGYAAAYDGKTKLHNWCMWDYD